VEVAGCRLANQTELVFNKFRIGKEKFHCTVNSTMDNNSPLTADARNCQENRKGHRYIDGNTDDFDKWYQG
jgi:hypothetical protein